MFRDLKEYQEIAKIYADKVSKPENLEERRGSSSAQLAQNRKDAFKPATPPQKGAGGGVGNPTNTRGTGTGAVKFKKPQGSAQGRTKRPEVKKEPEYKPEKGVVYGQRTNEIGAQGGGKPSTGDLSMFKDKEAKPLTKKQKFDKKFIKKDKGVGFVRRGTPMAQRAENKEKNKMRAQEMAKKRIADKKAGNASPQLSGKERAQQMAKARIAAKKAAMEEYTPYDIVLEYLLSSEQVATIEEANYVMTEMDAETIQSVVKEFLGGEKGDGYIGHPRLNIKNPLNPPKKEKKKTESSKGLFKSLGNRATDIENMLK